MKLLTLVRHAKSSWRHEGLRDFERPLNGRGWRDAPLMGQRYAAQGYKPDLLLSSYATRSLTTARIFAINLAYPVSRLQIHDEAYAASASELESLIASLKDNPEHLCLFGHNPGLTDLVNYLTDMDLDNLPTAGVVTLQLDIAGWADISRNCATVLYFSYPKKAELD